MCSWRGECAASEENNNTKERAERGERKYQGQNTDCLREREEVILGTGSGEVVQNTGKAGRVASELQ